MTYIVRVTKRFILNPRHLACVPSYTLSKYKNSDLYSFSVMLNLVLRSTVKKAFCLNQRRYCRDNFDFTSQIIPVETKPSELPAKRKISKDVILQLEAISLVNFGDEEGIKIVEEAISYADKLEEVNTDGVKPLFTVLENESLYLREDNVKSDVNTADLLSHAEKTFEGYYTAPVGNIPYYLSSDSPRPLNSDSSKPDKEKAERFAF